MIKFNMHHDHVCIHTQYMYVAQYHISTPIKNILQDLAKTFQDLASWQEICSQLFKLARIFLILQDSCSKSMRKSYIA